MWFDTVEEYYKDGLYSKYDVKVFVVAKMITEEEYEKITGDKYTPSV